MLKLYANNGTHSNINIDQHRFGQTPVCGVVVLVVYSLLFLFYDVACCFRDCVVIVFDWFVVLGIRLCAPCCGVVCIMFVVADVVVMCVVVLFSSFAFVVCFVMFDCV